MAWLRLLFALLWANARCSSQGLEDRCSFDDGRCGTMDRISRTKEGQQKLNILNTNEEARRWLHSCNIERRDWPQGSTTLVTGTKPYIVSVPSGRNAKLSDMMVRDKLLAEMGDMNCTPSQVASTRRGIHSMILRDYVEDWMTREVHRNPENNRYVFGEFGDEWAPFRDAYALPQCRACTRDRVAITIGLGGLHTGAPWHFHDAGFVEVLHGQKHFALLPPKDIAVPLIDAAIKNLSQLHWYLEERPRLEREGHLNALLECTINAGEILYFPPHWHHGVVNLHSYNAFVSTFLDHKAKEDE